MKALPVYFRGIENVEVRHYGQIGEKVSSMHGLVFELRRVSVSECVPWHEVNELLVKKYIKKIKKGNEVPPIILMNGRIEDGHHRFEATVRVGLETILAYVQVSRKPLPVIA